MVRKTKIETLATRDKLIDCAEKLFIRHGVSRTTLQNIADEADVTRGAIYWHFGDKAGLFDAMLLRIKMPFEAAMQAIELEDVSDAIGNLKKYAALVFLVTESDPRARRVFEILTLKVEFVDELAVARQRRAEMQLAWMANAERIIAAAVSSGRMAPDVNPFAAALGIWSLIDGLLRSWMIAPTSFSLSDMGKEIVSAYLDALLDVSVRR